MFTSQCFLAESSYSLRFINKFESSYTVSNVSWKSLGPLLKCTFCDLSRSSALILPFQIPIAHFDQIVEKRGKPNSRQFYMNLHSNFPPVTAMNAFRDTLSNLNLHNFLYKSDTINLPK